MKSLYDENFRYTQTAQDIEQVFAPIVLAVFSHYVPQGYSPREISHVLQQVIADTEYETLLNLVKEEQ